MVPMVITRDTWDNLADVAIVRTGQPLSIWEACCVYYNLCATSVITSFSLNLWNLWRRLDGTKGCTYSDYWELPAIYVEACEVIESELATIQNRAQKEIVVKNLLKKR